MGKRIGVLGLVNYIDHPTDKNFRVFNFNTREEADLFKSILEEKKLFFEMDKEEHEEEVMYLFAVNQRDFEKAQTANYAVSAQIRKNIIPFPILRYTLLITVLGLIIFAFYGYLKQ